MYRSIEFLNIKAKYWYSENLKVTEGKAVFLGGMDEVEGIDKWAVYEQTGYWIERMMKCAHLIEDKWLYEKVKPKLYSPIEKADDDGYIESLLIKDRNSNNNYSVIYREICKFAAILHMHTGKEIYKKLL